MAARTLTPEQAKEAFLLAIGAGAGVAEACTAASRSRKWYENLRSSDKDFAAKVDATRERRAKAADAGKDPELYNLSFAEWRKRFLNRETYPHMQNLVDVLEGRDPSWLHPSMTWEPASRDRVIMNIPVYHCATLDTPVFSRDGWKSIGDVTEDDWLLGDEGEFFPVVETWMQDEDADLYEVEFDTGDVVTTDAGHLWVVTKTFTGKECEMTTEALMGDLRWDNKQNAYKWKVGVTAAFDAPEADLPVDPYLLGYWLGDGDKNGSRLTVGVEDLSSLTGHLDDLGLTYSMRGDTRSPETTKVVYVHGIRKGLPLGHKHIPAAYFMASYKQRLALLQGLMDTDGTIDPRDGRASFTQVSDDLTLDVYRLVASLGLKPYRKSEKQSKTSPYGTPRSERINRIYFKPNGDPVFRLERKVSRQKVTGKGCKTNYRVIRDIRPAGRGAVKCITVGSPGNLYAIGDGLIKTHNAKSQTITVDWVTYKLCLNPNLQILIVSKKQEQAKKFLYQIKQRFTSNLYVELQMAYGGQDGFKGDVWSSNMIYLAGRDSDEKDPNVEAVGLGGQIYGSRADIIILDDCIVGSNANQFENQITWIESEVENRVFDGVIAFVGTRLAPQDLYSEITKGERYMSGKSPWTYLAMPMVLEFAEDPKDWVTLWPYSHMPMDRTDETPPGPNGMYTAWDGVRAAHTRASKPPRTFELVYQQRALGDNMTFDSRCVWGSVDRRRKPGPLRPGEWGGRRAGMEGMYSILSVDPAGTGEAFLLAYAVDRQTKMRYVLNAWTGTHTKPSWYMQMLQQIAPEYHIQELVIEKQGYSNWLYADEKIVEYCRNNGIKITPHYTGHGNKVDPDFGVASVADLFGTIQRRNSGLGERTGQEEHAADNLIHLPDPDKSPALRMLIDQLLVWEPSKSGAKLRQDGPMALWFAETRARGVLPGGQSTGSQQNFVHANRWLSPRARAGRFVRPSIFTN